LSISGGQIVGNEGLSTAVAYLGAAIVAGYVIAGFLAVAYGAALTVMARGRHPKPTSPVAGFTATPAAKRWYGVAFIIPPALAWGVSFMFHPTSAATENLALLWLAAPGTFVVCMLFARAYSNRDVKRAILTGAAPGYVMSPDRGWRRKGDSWASVNDRVWWNGYAWVRAAAEVPDDALRSPDGNYWWTGSFWCPMPPLPKRRKDAPRAAAATF
jgi:hypothetical protein